MTQEQERVTPSPTTRRDDHAEEAIESIRFVLQPPRRDEQSRAGLTWRIYREFEAAPGLSLTLTDAAQRFGIPPAVCSRVFCRLVGEDVLALRSDNRYGLSVHLA